VTAGDTGGRTRSALVHQLRHTFVSLWVAAGANAEVSVRAGHSSVAFTLDRYGHLYHDQDDAIADRLDDLLGRARAASDAAVHPLEAGTRIEDVSTVCPDEDNEPKAEAS
jgi:hypothetical protein